MKFTKMHGCGNDYVYVNCFEEVVENPSEAAIKVSKRHFGVGSDGMILICPSEVADFQMKMYNADGSMGEMCGNGIRCVAKYLFDNKIVTKHNTAVTIAINPNTKSASGIGKFKYTKPMHKASILVAIA